MRDAMARSKFEQRNAHEEGAFILRDSEGNLSVEPWPTLGRHAIAPPYYPDGKIGNKQIVGCFHTHPTTDWLRLQGPSLPDVLAHIINPTAWGEEFIMSQEKIYRIEDDGMTTVVGDTKDLLES
jgi:hypothetical protein